VALALLLVASAGVLVRSVGALAALDTGIEPDGVVTAQLVAGAGDFPAADRPALFRRLTERVSALPGVRSAGLTQKLPLGEPGWITGVDTPEGEVFTAARFVTPGYLATLGVPLLRGRAFDPVADGAEATRSVLVNETLARRVWGSQDPLGRTLVDTFGRDVVVVGVVGDVKEGRLTDEAGPAMYTPLAQNPFLALSLVARIDPGGEDDLARALRAAVRDADPRLAVQRVTPLAEVVAAAQGEVRQVMRILTLLAGLALALGAVGVYGVLSHWVARRRRAWALSLALGATQGRVIRTVLVRGATLVGVGLMVGLGVFVLAAGAAEALLYGVGPLDPVSLAISVATVLGAGALAAGVPAVRAARVDPMISLKGD
jgi:predicted permease